MSVPVMNWEIDKPANRVLLFPVGLSLWVRPLRMAKLMKLLDASSLVIVAYTPPDAVIAVRIELACTLEEESRKPKETRIP